MRVLIPGGAGFIGSHLADALIARGDTVTILDNLSTGSKKNIAHLEGKATVFEGDIRDEKLVHQLVEASDLVLHMAAVLGVNNILDKTIESLSINFTGSEVVRGAATALNKCIINAITSEIYGKNPAQPLNEESDRVVGAPQKIRWTYSDAKALKEAIAHTLHKTHGLKVTTVRLFNTVGPRQTGQYGMVFPRFVKSAVTNQPITIYGGGTQSRVFCHVADAVRAILTLAADDSTIGNYFNVGGVGEVSIKELAEKLSLVLNQNLKLLTPHIRMPTQQVMKICSAASSTSPKLKRQSTGHQQTRWIKSLMMLQIVFRVNDLIFIHE
jgi:UDP-glucose 4-epimerase